MNFTTRFKIGDRVRIIGTQRTFTVGKIRLQTLPDQPALVLVEYCAIWNSGEQGVFSPENRLERGKKRGTSK